MESRWSRWDFLLFEQHATHSIDAEEAYRSFGRVGLEYGPTHRTLAAVCSIEQGALARLYLRSDAREMAAAYGTFDVLLNTISGHSPLDTCPRHALRACICPRFAFYARLPLATLRPAYVSLKASPLVGRYCAHWVLVRCASAHHVAWGAWGAF